MKASAQVWKRAVPKRQKLSHRLTGQLPSVWRL